MNKIETIKLNNGVEMPLEGFGVFQVPNLAVCESFVALSPAGSSGCSKESNRSFFTTCADRLKENSAVHTAARIGFIRLSFVIMV